MKTEEISSIATDYNGVRFRSRMESRCAHLFDRLGWDWKYEPFSIMLPNGIPYTPDFWIEGPACYMIVECRGYENPRSIRQLDGFVDLIEVYQGFEIPGSGGDHVQHFMIIGPDRVRLYDSFGLSRKEGVPASQRRPHGCGSGALYRCACGWSPLNEAQWCTTCEEVASHSMMLSVKQGKLFLNGASSEDL